MGVYARRFDIVVVGAGHAGCEAAHACARLGLDTLMLGMNLDTVAAMSCNPAIGGLAKGHLVREIDALGGVMARAADANGIQFKMLNTSKGPAVQAPRAQCDKAAYRAWMKSHLEGLPGLSLKQAQVERLIVDKDGRRVLGVLTKTGLEFHAQAVILTTGTFLQGLIHIGDHRISSGRAGEAAAMGLSASLGELGLELGRLKTGTNPRVDRRSLDFSCFTEFPGDSSIQPFSYTTDPATLSNKTLCWTVKTDAGVHQAIRDSLVRSPLYNGTIHGIGPRYCPSIEDKVVRFPEKEWHQIIIEPEGLNTSELYLNGLSTSLPEEDQLHFLRKLSGFERVEIMRPGYAVEYDYVLPTQLTHALATRSWEGLYLAGQINGTSGYEEAAAQGLLAGINAARWVQGQAPVVLGREQAYMGVLIDDLVSKGTAEPYRLFTSLAEFRLLLRQDNADLRLMDLGAEIGLLDPEVHAEFRLRRDQLAKELERLEKTRLNPGTELNAALAQLESPPLEEAVTLATLLKRPELCWSDLKFLSSAASGSPEKNPADPDLATTVWKQAEIQLKYEGYIRRQLIQVEQFRHLEDKHLPADLDYQAIYGLSLEARQKLSKLRPSSLGQAGRISGVSPADISVLLISLEARRQAPV
ncbi:MAG TPA: tRNA uridine-5-carboxymethylaminomethyl(34) synthesis enzyme MnmG [bacterium]|jgi:tRNA uridine 5-carboxymethylaminomethyl modification enzyme|nr:tRNA uridine-5-carboxymethylaminomethyl(34) synthesis enzyme MnmG [bacterium]